MAPKKTPLVDDPISIPGAGLSTAWRNAWLATGDDEENPALYKSMIVEAHDHGLLFASLDGHVVFTAFAPYSDLSTRPGLDEAPTSTVLFGDWDGRGAALMGHIAREAKAAAKADRDYDVRLSVGDLDQGRQFEGMERKALVIEIPGETLRLPTIEIEPVSWRKAFGGQPKAMSRALVAPQLLTRFGSLRGFTGAVALSFVKSGTIMFEAPDSDCHLLGAMVPAGKGIEG